MKLCAFRIVKSKEAIPFYIRRRRIQQGYASDIGRAVHLVFYNEAA
jgi:hypothetical protein